MMRKYNGMPELLEQFMAERGADEQWVTVQELRDRFSLTRYQCNTVSGFLRRLAYGPFGQFPYIVVRIETVDRARLSDRPMCRYRVKRKEMKSVDLPGRFVMETGPAEERNLF